MNDVVGWAGIPGTFPTGIMVSAMREALPVSRDDWNRTIVNDLYSLYKMGVQDKGYPIVKPGQFEVMEYMVENSNISENHIRVFLATLYMLAEKGDIELKFWNIPLQAEKGIIPGIKDMTKNIEKMSSAVKWGSIALIFAGVTYLSWPAIKALRNRAKSKRARS